MPTMSNLSQRIESDEAGLTLSTCHQCRQRKLKLSASCKNIKGNKPCSLKMCEPCLFNRYGEVAQIVSQLKGWKCPKCRGICNCSCCMKKSGYKPTGKLTPKAKENGYPSVLELLQSGCAKTKIEAEKSSKSSINKKKREGLSEISISAANNVPISGKTNGKKARTNKENPKDGEVKNNAEIQKKRKRSVIDLTSEETNEEASKMSKNAKPNGYGKDTLSLEIVLKGTNETYEKHSKEKSSQKSRDKKKSSNGSHVKKLTAFFNGLNNPSPRTEVGTTSTVTSNPLKPHNLIIKTSQKEKEPSLPSGIRVNSVSGIDFSPEDVGEALQFFEFCEAFGKKFLNLKNGQAEAIIRDILNNKRQLRSQSRFQNSLLSQTHKTLLNIIKRNKSQGDDASEKQSWVESLLGIVAKLKHVPDEFARERFDKGFDYYNGLKASDKLRLLNMLCDEALNTKEIRKWINDQYALVLKKQKGEKDTVAEAKTKEREITKRIQEFVKSGSKNADFSNSLANLKNEAKEARKSIAEAMSVISNDDNGHAFLRTEPSLTDSSGRVFWRLRCCHGLSDVLFQDIESSSLGVDAWFSFDERHEDDVKKYVDWIKKRLASKIPLTVEL